MVLTLSHIGCFISILLGVFLFFVKSPHRLSNRLLGSFLILTALEISAWFSDRYLAAAPALLMLRITTGLLQTPLFFLYVVSVCRSDFRLNRIHLLHTLPFVAINILLIPAFYTKDYAGQLSFLSGFPISIYNMGITVTAHIQFIVYFIGIFMILQRYKTLLMENQSQTGLNAYRWLFQLSIILCIVHGIIIIKTIVGSYGDSPAFSLLTVVVSFNAILVLSWLTLKALDQPELFKGMPARLLTARELMLQPQQEPGELNSTAGKEVIPTEEPAETEENKTAGIFPGDLLQNKKKSGNPPIQINTALIAELRSYFKTEKPYLDPDLTIHKIADALQVPVRELSICINHQLGIHFFDFVNEYRIRFAMTVLADPDQKNKTVLEILYEAGFNSKSSFHSAFMKHSDITPTMYRKNALEKTKKT